MSTDRKGSKGSQEESKRQADLPEDSPGPGEKVKRIKSAAQRVAQDVKEAFVSSRDFRVLFRDMRDQCSSAAKRKLSDEVREKFNTRLAHVSFPHDLGALAYMTQHPIYNEALKGWVEAVETEVLEPLISIKIGPYVCAANPDSWYSRVLAPFIDTGITTDSKLLTNLSTYLGNSTPSDADKSLLQLASREVSGLSYVQTSLGPFYLTPGLNVLVGREGTGKTLRVNALVESLKKSDIRTGLIHFSEPEAGQISDWHTLMNVLLCALQDPGRVVIVDSMKSIFSLPGSLTTGGISRAALDDLNHLSAALAASGRVVVFVLNPNSANQAVMDELDALLISNCSAVTTLKASGEQQVSQRSQTRVVRRTVSASTNQSPVSTAVDSYSITAFSNFKAE